MVFRLMLRRFRRCIEQPALGFQLGNVAVVPVCFRFDRRLNGIDDKRSVEVEEGLPAAGLHPPMNIAPVPAMPTSGLSLLRFQGSGKRWLTGTETRLPGEISSLQWQGHLTEASLPKGQLPPWLPVSRLTDGFRGACERKGLSQVRGARRPESGCARQYREPSSQSCQWVGRADEPRHSPEIGFDARCWPGIS